MKGRLLSRFLLSFIVVALVATGITAGISLGAMSLLFKRYLAGSQSIRSQQVQVLLTMYYQNTGSWRGVQDILAGTPQKRKIRIFMGPAPWSGGAMVAHEDRLLLADESGLIIGDTEETRLGAHLTPLEKSHGIPITVNGNQVGIMVVSSPMRTGLASLEQYFRMSMLLAVMVAAFVGILLALLLGITISRRIVAPIASLAIASRKIAGKDFSQRLPIESNDEIGDLAKSFNTMAQELQKTEKLRQDLLGDVVHELRTPLTILRANLEGLQEGVVSATPEIITSLNDEVLRMTRLVTDLQELNLAEAGRLPLHKRPTDIISLLNHIISAVSAEALSRGIGIETDFPPDLPQAFVDPDRVSQVLMNLLSNAVRYTPSGGKIKMAATAFGSMSGTSGISSPIIQITVENTGVMIPREELPHVFERFYRGEKSRSRAYGGSGLGLAIAKGLVEAHGGRIWVESDQDVTLFGFTLPALQVGADASEPSQCRQSMEKGI